MPDYPRAKAVLNKKLRQAIDARISRREPLLGHAPRFMRHEGKQTQLEHADGSISNSWLEPSEAEVILSRAEMRHISPEALAEKLAALADSLAGQQAGMLFAKINEVAQVEGNTIDAAGKPFSKELFLAALSKIEINFNEATGEPTGPGLVIPEQRAAEFFKEIVSWESDTAFQAAFDAVMAEKREEWRARESSRRLAD